MVLSTRAQNALLAALAAVAVGASCFAVWSVNQPHPSLTEAEDTGSPAGPTGAAASATATSYPSAGPDNAGATATMEPAASTSGPDDAEPMAESPEPVTVEAWASAWEDEADLLVIGDGYSNLTTQWVQEWATFVAQERPVLIRHWGEAEDRAFTPAIELSDGDGPSLRVWSASRAGTTITDAADRLDRFDRAAPEPDAILVSLGMDSEDEEIGPAMDELLAGMDHVPVLVSIAPGGLYPSGVADELLAWAEGNDERVAVVDLREAGLVEPTAEEWAMAFRRALDDAGR